MGGGGTGAPALACSPLCRSTALPDIEPPIDRLRAEMDLRFATLRADIERRLNTQTWTIVGTLFALGALLTATNLWGG